VVVADSLNDRVVEYQRRDGSWEQTWVWNDSETIWPRDADRLPNGHTLVSDSNGNRVLEVNESGDVVWSVPYYSVYEAERLGTGDESAGGPSAVRANLTSRTASGNPRGAYEEVAHALLPRKTVNGLTFVLPMWAGLGELLAVTVAVLAVLAWAGLELRDSSLDVGLRWPLILRR
jgi:hypothetical protein